MGDWRKFDCLFADETPRSIINEIDFGVDYVVEPPSSALERAWQRWHYAELINGGVKGGCDR